MLDGSTAVSIEPLGAGGALLSGHGADSRSLACGRKETGSSSGRELIAPDQFSVRKVAPCFPHFPTFSVTEKGDRCHSTLPPLPL